MPAVTAAKTPAASAMGAATDVLPGERTTPRPTKTKPVVAGGTKRLWLHRAVFIVTRLRGHLRDNSGGVEGGARLSALASRFAAGRCNPCYLSAVEIFITVSNHNVLKPGQVWLI